MKKRLDQAVQDQFPALSRTQIQSLIMQGKVTVDGQIQTKPGVQVSEHQAIHVDWQEPRFVSRAGFKLQKALEYFDITVHNLVALDAGLSTGGFTDCLLQAGAQRVYGVDVGYGQVHEKIRNDARVVVMERINVRHLQPLPELVDIVTLDLSFISVLKVLPAVIANMKPGAKLIVLIKPQFEAQKEQVGPGGIIKDPRIHEQVIETVTSGIKEQGFTLIGITESPIEGTMGNKEFLAYFIKN